MSAPPQSGLRHGTFVASMVAGAVLLAAGCSSMAPVPGGEQARYKIGNPYEVGGVRYFPKEDYTYAETGIASWYGPKFHGKPTANGEIFDMNAVSAAHKTLPLPSVVRVTNIDNGRVLKMRVNDRGPFVPGRIIDLSRRAADLIGMRRKGTARVRVEILADESRRLKQLAQAGHLPLLPEAPPSTREAALAGVSGPSSDTPFPPAKRFMVQVGAFSERDFAVRAVDRLGGRGPVRIAKGRVGGGEFYRVRIGPLRGFAEAEALQRSVAASGFPGAFVVVD